MNPFDSFFTVEGIFFVWIIHGYVENLPFSLSWMHNFISFACM